MNAVHLAANQNAKPDPCRNTIAYPWAAVYHCANKTNQQLFYLFHPLTGSGIFAHAFTESAGICSPDGVTHTFSFFIKWPVVV